MPNFVLIAALCVSAAVYAARAVLPALLTAAGGAPGLDLLIVGSPELSPGQCSAATCFIVVY